MTKDIKEKFTEQSKLNINWATKELALDLLKDIRIITLTTDDEDILYLQDEKTLVYKILNKKTLEKRVARELSKRHIYAKTEQVKDMVTVMIYQSYTETYEYESVVKHIMVNNGIIIIEPTSITFTELEENRLSKAIALKRIDLDYIPDAHKEQNEIVEKFFSDIMVNDKELVEYLWHILATPFVERTKYEKAFIFYGETGANGKTVLAELISKVYCKRNITHVELSDMRDYSLAIMEKGFINWVPDLEKYDDWPNFKKIVTGESLVVNVKYADPVEKELSTQLFINSNILPKLGTSRDGGYSRRLEFIPFNKTFKGEDKDPQILRKLSTKENLEWILSKLLNVVKELNDDYSGNWFVENEPKVVAALKKEQAMADSSPLAFIDWLIDSIEVDAFKKIKINIEDMSLEQLEFNQEVGEINKKHGPILYRPKVYKIYREYCKQEGIHPLAKENFEKQTKGSVIELDKETRVATSRGIYTTEIKNILGGKNE